GFAARENAACARCRTNSNGDCHVKKKIRDIQYGVGPIGASIVKLLREKNAIEICGAIDTDPAKAGRDLGEVVGAADAPWGVNFRGRDRSSESSGGRGDSLDVVDLAQGYGSVAGVPGSGIVRGFDVRGALLSLPDVSRTGREARRDGEGLGSGAGRNGSESGICDGQAGDHAGGGFAANRARESAARGERFEAAAAAAEEDRRGDERRRVSREGKRRRDQARGPAGVRSDGGRQPGTGGG